MRRRVLVGFICLSTAAAALGAAGCASAPPPVAPVITFEQKMSWILRLEDQRLLRDPAPLVPVAPPAARGKRSPAVLPQPVADLTGLLADPEARVRRRAALAIGRVGLQEGVAPLVGRLADPEPEVRQMAAFALGLIGSATAAGPLRAALQDPAPEVQGRAAEALGLIGDSDGAAAVGEMAAAHVRSGVLAQIGPDEMGYPLDPAVEAFRLGIYALVRLNAYAPLAGAVLDSSGRSRVRWWPVAYALQRIGDKRGYQALLDLARGQGSCVRAFAARGLGVLKDRAAVDTLVPLVQAWQADPRAALAAARALGQIGDSRAAAALLKTLQTAGIDPALRMELVTALGGVRAAGAVDPLLDLLSDPSPALRAAALGALRDIDVQNFLVVLSGLDADPHWSVRAALAAVLGTLDRDAAAPRLTAMLKDADQRVIPSVLAALVKLRVPGIETMLLEHLKSGDVVVRMAAASGLGELKPGGGAAALVAMFRKGETDQSYVARAAALTALAKYDRQAAAPVLRDALQDRDWAVRVRAAELLKTVEPSVDAATLIRPAPGRPPGDYEAPGLVNPTVSPHAYLDTDKGTIEIELAVLDAPLTADNFTRLARQGFFNGLPIHRLVPDFVLQHGDPRGDGEGGPGYTIRDELNERPYLRGTVGMALDWEDTGGSQFFITYSPQPHLDARYTVFGHVTAGLDVLDRLQRWDVVRQVRVWDGNEMSGRSGGRAEPD